MMLGPGGPGLMGQTAQVFFVGPDAEGTEVTWDVSGQSMFDSPSLVVPGRQNFAEGSIYRLKLSNMPERPGVDLYPTLEIGPRTPRSDAFLSHTPIPIQFTDEDFDQVTAGNYITKVVYLPDPEFQDLALTGVETLVSTRLDPGVDPIKEADRRGAILAIVRIGNKDLQLPGMEGVVDSAVIPASHMGGRMPAGMPAGMPAPAFAPAALPPQHVAGWTGPQWGMPISGTPIGLPGPPHVPLGRGAGLQRHVMKNHTHVHLPPPTRNVKIDVKQTPGYSYPQPVNHVRIHENVKAPHGNFWTPWSNHHELVQIPGCANGQCGQCSSCLGQGQ